MTPVFRALGYSKHGRERWLHLQVRNEERVYRPTEARGTGFLFDLHPDAVHWRSMFPTLYGGRKIDTMRACAYIHRLCIEAGEYKPAPAEGKPE